MSAAMSRDRKNGKTKQYRYNQRAAATGYTQVHDADNICQSDSGAVQCG